MSKHDKNSMHRGNNRYREYDEMTSSSNELEKESKSQASCENNKPNIYTEQLEEREINYNDQLTKVAPIRTTHNDPNKKINNNELNWLGNKTAVAKRLPLRSEQEEEYEMEDKQHEYEEQQEEEQEEEEEEENDIYSNKSIDAKSPSVDVFVEESPSHTHVYRLQTHGANSDLQQQQQQGKQQEQGNANKGDSGLGNTHNLSNEQRGQQLVSFNNKSLRVLQQGSEAGNKFYEEDYDVKEKKLEREQEQEQEHTTSHREHNQFYSEVSNLRYDNTSNAKKLQNAPIFEMNNIANSNNCNNCVNESLEGNSNTLVSKNVTEEEKKNASGVTYDSSWYSRASHYLLPRIDARFARDAWYIENENNNNTNNNTNNTCKENGNIVEVGIAHCMLSEVRLVLFAALTFLSLIFTIVSLPTSQLDVKNNGCYTY